MEFTNLFDKAINDIVYYEKMRATEHRENTVKEINDFEPEIKEMGGRLSSHPRSSPTFLEGVNEHYQTIIEFDNGWGASIIKGDYIHDLELMLLEIDEDEFELTNHQVDYLDTEQVMFILKLISKLPNRKNEE